MADRFGVARSRAEVRGLVIARLRRGPLTSVQNARADYSTRSVAATAVAARRRGLRILPIPCLPVRYCLKRFLSQPLRPRRALHHGREDMAPLQLSRLLTRSQPRGCSRVRRAATPSLADGLLPRMPRMWSSGKAAASPGLGDLRHELRELEDLFGALGRHGPEVPVASGLLCPPRESGGPFSPGVHHRLRYRQADAGGQRVPSLVTLRLTSDERSDGDLVRGGPSRPLALALPERACGEGGYRLRTFCASRANPDSDGRSTIHPEQAREEAVPALPRDPLRHRRGLGDLRRRRPPAALPPVAPPSSLESRWAR